MPRPRPVTDKRCPRCSTVKLLSEFYESTKYDGGYSTYCKPCISVTNKAGRKPARDNSVKRKYYASHSDHFRELSRNNAAKYKQFNPAGWRAKKFFETRGHDVAPDLTRSYLESLFLTTTHCQCCSSPLTLKYESRGTRQYRSNPSAPSVDRVNNNRGYTRSNIAIICWQCNFRKTDLTLDDLDTFGSYIRRYGDFS